MCELIRGRSFILYAMRLSILAPIRFLWNSTRGHRLAPWSSPYMRWRVETYSGKKAETLTTRDVLGFLWNSRWEFLSYLGWIAQLDSEAHKRV
ncbi:MAG: hypothetical protein WB424_17200 [Terracidiphilus sp.]